MWAVVVELLFNVLLFRRGKTPAAVVVVIVVVVFGLAIVTIVNNAVLGT